MKKHLFKAALLTVCLVIAFAFTACGSGSEEAESAAETSTAVEMGETMAKIKESGKIVMGVNATYAPFEFRSASEDRVRPVSLLPSLRNLFPMGV